MEYLDWLEDKSLQFIREWQLQHPVPRFVRRNSCSDNHDDDHVDHPACCNFEDWKIYRMFRLKVCILVDGCKNIYECFKD